VIDGELTIYVGDERVEAGPGDFVLRPQGVPHAHVARSEQAESLATFAPASMDRFFEELGGVPVVPGEPAPAASYHDPEEFARGAARWGVEIVGPPPTWSDAEMASQEQAVAQHRQRSYELWQRMARPWERRRQLSWRFTRQVSEWLVDRIDPKPGETLLELAAGTGETGFLAAGRLGPAGRLISSDFAREMVQAAKRVATDLGIANVEFRVLDAEQLELEVASIDGVLCRFSFMLMSDPPRALRETRRVLRPGNGLAFSTWADPGRNPWMTLSARLMIERGLMEPFSFDGPGMFALADADTIVPLLTAAGFAEIEVEEMELRWRFDGPDELWTFASELQGPVALAIARLDWHERRQVRAALEERAAAFAPISGYELPGMSINVIAA
jgi:ubiquinone/menaquinone biosynthesis C-methylase UbiE